MLVSKLNGKRVAIYIRVSSFEQAANGLSLRMQQEELTRWAKENGYVIHDYYIDDGYTATNLKRPALQRMLADSYNFDMIIFVKLDRFSRGVANYYKIMETLERTKTHWNAIFEDYDTETSDGQFWINIYLAMAQKEAAQASERTRAVNKNKIENGEFPAANAPRGYMRETVNGKTLLVPDPKETGLIREIFEHFERYSSMRLTLLHIREKYGNIVSSQTIKNILLNKIYIGTYVHKRLGEYPDFCEPIIKDEQFYKVQDLIQKNRKIYNDGNKPKQRNYIFSGLLTCEICGNRMTSWSGKNKPINGVPQYRKGYKCYLHHNRKECQNTKQINEKRIEEYLINHIRPLIEKKIISYKIEEKKDKESPATKIKEQIKRTENRMSKLKDLYLDDIIQKNEYEKSYNELIVKHEELNRELKSAEEGKQEFNIELYKSFLEQDFEKLYYTLEEEDRRRLWLSVIKKIEIGIDTINPHFF